MTERDKLILLKIYEYCEDIENSISRFGNSYDIFRSDVDYKQSVSFGIFQIGELANGLSDGLRNESTDAINWKQIRGMRNVIAHGYGNIKLDVLWETIQNDVPVLKAFCERMLPEDISL